MAQNSVYMLLPSAGSPDKPRELLKLPDEIWSYIGKLAVDNAPVINERAFRTPTTKVYRSKAAAKAARATRDEKYRIRYNNKARAVFYQPAITRVCRVLRAELLPYYYQTKIDLLWFTAMARRYSLANWLGAIGEINRRHIRRLFFMQHGETESSHAWPERRFKHDLRQKGIEVVLREVEPAVPGWWTYKIEFK